MDNQQSVTQWVHRVVRGEQGQAQEELVRRFLHRLTSLARTKLRDIGGYEDEQDVALSALKSFLIRAPKQEFDQLTDRNALWSLLAAITIKKSISVRRKMFAQKRDVRRAQGFEELMHSGPTPEFLDSVFDEGNRLLDALDDDSLRQVASLRMEGYSNDEIAQQIQRSVKTVERKLNLIRKRFVAELDREEE